MLVSWFLGGGAWFLQEVHLLPFCGRQQYRVLKPSLLHARGTSRISRLVGCTQDLGFFWSVSPLLCVGQTAIPQNAWYFWDYSVGGGVLLSLHTVTEVLRNTFVSAEQQLGSNWYLCHPTNKEEGEEEGQQPGMGCTWHEDNSLGSWLGSKEEGCWKWILWEVTVSDVLRVKC